MGRTTGFLSTGISLEATYGAIESWLTAFLQRMLANLANAIFSSAQVL